MGEGGLPHYYLNSLREHYPISMHGVGMSLGSANGIEIHHLKRLKSLVERYEPAVVSEHIAWSHWNKNFLSDLLPLPYTRESLQIVCNNIEHVQDTLGRTILVENPSTYVSFKHNDFSEPEFFRLLHQRTGCDLLLDINNIVVSAANNNFESRAYLHDFPVEAVKECHLAGHTVKKLTGDKTIRIDDHSSAVCDEVWQLYRDFLGLKGSPVASLVEWDTEIPELHSLLDESNKADAISHEVHGKREACL